MKKVFLMSVLGLTLSLAACDNSKEGSGTTRVNVRLTDGPGAYDALYLSVKEVKVISSGGESSLPVNSNPINILNFRMGKDTLIASQDIPAGRLQEVRLVLNDTGNRVVVNGISYPLTTPSGQSSGVKLKIQDDLTEGVAYTLLLDFDAAKSIVQTGNGKYILKPVIRAIPNAVSGSITGIVSPAASSPKIYAIAGTDTLGTISDSNGKFWFPGVPAGTYKVEFKPVSPYVNKTIDNVIVVTGSVKDIGTVTIN